MIRETRRHFHRVIVLAQALTHQNRLRMSKHAQQREGDRAIEFADAEAAILGHDARVIGENPDHPEGTTYTIAGARFDGDMIHVVVAFNTEEIEDATALEVVTVMYPYQERSR